MIRRRLLLLLVTTVVLLTAAGVAVAFWTTSGAGAGSALTGTLAPPTNVTAVATQLGRIQSGDRLLRHPHPQQRQLVCCSMRHFPCATNDSCVL
jgi:hypothetical protein